jgi:hypothetical protein
MKRIDLSRPEFGFVVATRAALAAGIGLLATGRLRPRSRKRLGIALSVVGALTTVPALLLVFGRAPGRDTGRSAAA